MTKTSKIVLALIGLLLILGGIYYATLSTPTTPSGTICTMDARQCPDGTYVGRTGPNCQFVCPGGPTSQNNVPIVEGNAGLDGTVTTAPADTGK